MSRIEMYKCTITRLNLLAIEPKFQQHAALSSLHKNKILIIKQLKHTKRIN